jgi:DNA-nicking Smr family endonuclease
VYKFIPDCTLDLHGFTAREATPYIEDLRSQYDRGTRLRIVVGKGTHSKSLPVIPHLVKNTLDRQGISWAYAKRQDGGEGAIDCVISY